MTQPRRFMPMWKTGAVIFAMSLVLSALGAATPATSVAQAATCADFPNQAAAQEAANTRDSDGDGVYCESLPCPCSHEWHTQHKEEGSDGGDGLPPVKRWCPEAPPPGSLPRRVWPPRDRCGLHRGLLRVPRGQLAKAWRFIRRVRAALKGSASGYSRSEFGSAWTDSAVNIPWAGNGCGTRDDILRRDLTRVRLRSTDSCVVEAGRLRNPYLGTIMLFSKSDATAVPVDHVFPLSLAWQMGARDWSGERRVQIANDPLNLLAVDRSSNSSKGDSGPAEWLPPNRGIRCAYSVRFAQVARKYALPVTRADKRTMLHQCVSARTGASTRRCRRVVNPYPRSRYEGVDLSHILATRVSCRTARRVARGAHRKALATTPPRSGVRRFTWHGWKVKGDLRGRSDSYLARAGAKRIRWRF
jgi:Protein of unknown function (DUF1524)